ncbi:MAG TPA: HlyC/CorC family transporter [Thermopetrobacter sp.]|nr:HlyC/CorC family transporter [Thermopetrobacter sp.]
MSSLWLLAAAVAALLALSAFFSGSETSMTAASRARIHRLAQQGDARARIVEALLAMPERLIGAILLGNNLVNILASALTTSLFIAIFGPGGVLWATLIMTALVLVFGEVLPKTYAILNPERFALFVARPIRVVVTLFAPVVMVVERLVRATLGLFGADTRDAGNVLSFHEELRGAIDLHHDRGQVVRRDRDMLGGVLDLPELSVGDVMVHRTKMKSIDIARPPHDILRYVLDGGFTRYPVWEGSPDDIIGILHARDLLAALTGSGGDIGAIDIRQLLGDPWFVPDSTPLSDQLTAFLRRKQHFALVVDEYGELQGLVTLEDIMEEIVGDIADEHDRENFVVRRDGNAYIVDGAMPVRDLNRLYDWRLPEDEATTIAGLVIHEARMIPERGQTFTFHGFRFEVLGKVRHRITRLRITPLNRAPQPPAPEN